MFAYGEVFQTLLLIAAKYLHLMISLTYETSDQNNQAKIPGLEQS